ncbi:hypothetical protein CSC94_11510 [Zhengella mangrovi]|uniref:HNH domain-containing protein n=1 Tax=Zhengella mangrovi TaxID=1982044 RepID=A0A2G1QMN4_9HYPH|nr:HNH endonuclease [Zhengella mangrovi]PHP66734.1 hypothetical protein CSC94_11510 [Zhengella mangrovi]
MANTYANGRRAGTPWIEDDGVVVYEVRNPDRKTFGLSFSHEDFEGWAKDGREVEGYAEFPSREMPIPFIRRFSSGNELTFNSLPDMVDALQDCEVGDEIRFIFSDGQPSLGKIKRDVAEADEGSAFMATHKKYERDPRLAREIREEANGVCQICDTDFSERYGALGKSVIEAHHLMPVSEGERRTKKDDLIGICANCHRLTHAWMSDTMPGRVGLKKLRTALGMTRMSSHRG